MVILNSLSGPNSPCRSEPLGGQKFDERTERTREFSLFALVASTENHHNFLWQRKKSVEKR
jgi:hypothetical protein